VVKYHPKIPFDLLSRKRAKGRGRTLKMRSIKRTPARGR
jgi:hypothetical protein